jgi:ribosome maturation factor RimP
MDSLNKKIEQIASDSAKRNNLCLVDIIFRGNQNNPVIEVFVDGETGVSADECAEVSNEIKKVIDKDNFYKSYRLDVSSPGVERPLIYFWQFPKHVNRAFEIRYKTGNGVKTLVSKLSSIEDDVLTFSEKDEIKIKFKDIIKAKVLVSFNQRR